MKGRVLIIAGSDSSGGAGIQADIKTVMALGGYAATAITALTAQNTRGVYGVYEVPPAFVRQQIEVVLDDIGADIIKTGMLGNAAIAEIVADVLEQSSYKSIPLVLDPVMIAKGGESLLQSAALECLKKRLIPRALLVTPNLPELEALTGKGVVTIEDSIEAGYALRALGTQAVLIKGGHRPGSEVTDILISAEGAQRFTSQRIETRHTHGTGCTLASAIATLLAQGVSLADAVEKARAYVFQAIATAPGFGGGHGPLNHTMYLTES